jgi:hypothetical protein
MTSNRHLGTSHYFLKNGGDDGVFHPDSVLLDCNYQVMFIPEMRGIWNFFQD